jgi:FKBP-type peptidyl-prolyl cis-trans isomerase FklB
LLPARFHIKRKYRILLKFRRRFVLRFVYQSTKGFFMKKLIAIAVVLSLTGGSSMAQKKVPQTQKEKVGYSIGVNLGKNMKMQGLDIDQGLLLQGIKDGYNGSKAAMTDKDMESTMNAFQQEMVAKMQAKQKIDGDKNKKAGDTFLAANKKKEGVVTLPSGLQYKILKAGTGPKPTKDQTVRCFYRGSLVDGTEFDSSYKYGPEPAEFPVGQVIQGWIEALQLMPVGSKWQLFIPSDIAYGERGMGQVIGPNATLIFELELVSIK